MTVDPDLQSLGGAEKAAMLIMALGEDGAAQLFSMMDEDEIRAVSRHMATLGPADSQTVEALVADFAEQLTASGGVVGNYENTERLLSKALDSRMVDDIMAEIRGPEGHSLWDRLSRVEPQQLADFLEQEYPQTAAVVLSKLAPDHSARILPLLNEDFSMEVAARLLKLDPVRDDVLEEIESSLQEALLSKPNSTYNRDPHQHMAAILNRMDAAQEARFLDGLQERDENAAAHIKALMFTFEDLARLDAGALQTLIAAVDGDKLCLALKGASERMRAVFFGNMSERAAGMMQEDMLALGPVRLRDVEAAQRDLIEQAKSLAAKGDIALADERNDDKLVY